ncbi:Synaptic vesicle 2-related protein [Liparis tanakae]|uniref:Synaptic vesicle 2-related protein n=1 Tax=Liparis tanakae TaxID=230148 RepID=A0A4Z2ETM6_9TELE|nr:Synaptic vesicle 2-related protein [Liparis tanakae]
MAHGSWLMAHGVSSVPQVYPTASRALGLGMSSGMARVGALITPFVAQVMLESSLYLALSVYCCCCLLAAVASCALPIETAGRGLQEASRRQWGQEMDRWAAVHLRGERRGGPTERSIHLRSTPAPAASSGSSTITPPPPHGGLRGARHLERRGPFTEQHRQTQGDDASSERLQASSGRLVSSSGVFRASSGVFRASRLVFRRLQSVFRCLQGVSSRLQTSSGVFRASSGVFRHLQSVFRASRLVFRRLQASSERLQASSGAPLVLSFSGPLRASFGPPLLYDVAEQPRRLLGAAAVDREAEAPVAVVVYHLKRDAVFYWDWRAAEILIEQRRSS